MDNEIQNAIKDYHQQTKEGFNELQGKFEAIEQTVNSLSSDLTDIKTSNRDPRVPTLPDTKEGEEDPQSFIVNVKGQDIPTLKNNQKVSNYFPNTEKDANRDYLANYVKQQMGIRLPSNAVVSGDGIVPQHTASSIIDQVRAKSTISRAGASTVIVDGTTQFARVTGDQTVYEHTEGATDISESDVSFDAVAASPITLVAAVPLSMEVVEDSENLNNLLNMSLSAAFAQKQDSMALTKILADTNIPTSAAGQATDTWAGILTAVTAALAADQETPSAYVGSEADFMARASLTTTDGAWLGKPPVLAGMAELPTTKVADGTGIFGDFFNAFGFVYSAMDLRMEMLRWAKHTSGSHILVAYLRAVPIVFQPDLLFIQKAVV